MDLKELILLVLLMVCGSALAEEFEDSYHQDSIRFMGLWEKFRSSRFEKPDSALYYAQACARIAGLQKNIHWQGIAADQQGTALLISGRYMEALPFFLRSLEVSTARSDKYSEAFARSNIATIYMKMGDFAQANQDFRNSYRLFDQLGETLWKAGPLEGIGQSYASLGELDSALFYLERNIEVMKEAGHSSHAFNARMGIALILEKQGKVEEAEAIYRAELQADTLIDESMLKCVRLLQRAKSNEYFNDYNEAERLYSDCLHLSLANGFNTEGYQAHVGLSELYEQMDKPKLALRHLRSAVELQKLIYSNSSHATMSAMQAQIQSAQNEIELERQSALIAAQRARLILVIALAAFCLLGALLFFIRYRAKRDANQLLRERNSVMESMLEEKRLLLRELHHRVKNNMQTVSSLLRMQSRSLADEGSRVALQEAMRRVKSMALVHQDLYHGNGLIQVNMDDYLHKLVEGLIHSYGMEGRVDLVSDLSKVELDIDSAVPLGLIVNELVTNALKHAFPETRKGSIEVALTDLDDAIRLVVSDNGVGFQYASSGEPEDGKLGVGVDIVKTFASTLNAEWIVTNEKGTKVEILVKNFIRG